VHIYLFDQRSGAPYDGLRRPRLTAELPAEEIGPLVLDLVRSGPGHLTAPGAALGVVGEWRLELSGRGASRFESLRGSTEVEIR
jgi:copper transport protein